MKEKLLLSLCNTLKGYLSEGNSTRIIQSVLRAMKTQIHADYSVLVLQNEKTAYLDIVHSYEVSRSALQSFRRRVGTHTIARIFFSEPLIVVTPEDSKEDYEDLKLDDDYAMCIAVHIGYEAQSLGFLGIYFKEPKVFGLTTIHYLMAMAGACSAALEKEELLSLIGQLRRFDPETGIFCHQYFISRLEEEVGKSHRLEQPLALSIMEINNYKNTINCHGTQVAQVLLRELADILKTCIRGVDILGHIGLDEFIVAMPNTPIDAAKEVIEKFSALVDNSTFTENEVKSSLSFGITALHHHDSLEEFISRAQIALYRARKSGEGIMIANP